MVKVTLDTNVIISSIFWQNEAYKIMLLTENQIIQIFVSNIILKEVKDVITSEEKFQKFLEYEEKAIEDLMDTLIAKVTMIQTIIKTDIIKEHEADNRIVECSIDSNSEYLISYDNHILQQKEEINRLYKIKVLNPTEFLKIIEYSSIC